MRCGPTRSSRRSRLTCAGGTGFACRFRSTCARRSSRLHASSSRTNACCRCSLSSPFCVGIACFVTILVASRNHHYSAPNRFDADLACLTTAHQPFAQGWFARADRRGLPYHPPDSLPASHQTLSHANSLHSTTILVSNNLHTMSNLGATFHVCVAALDPRHRLGRSLSVKAINLKQ